MAGFGNKTEVEAFNFLDEIIELGKTYEIFTQGENLMLKHKATGEIAMTRCKTDGRTEFNLADIARSPNLQRLCKQLNLCQ